MAKITGTDRGETINGSRYDDDIYARGGNDVVYGNAGNDSIYGNAGADRLYGGSGNDILNGYEGNDVLIGGPGFDQLTGWDGADRFTFTSVTADDIGGGREYTDWILDFDRSQGDKIDLSTIDANRGASGNQAFHVVGAFHGRPGELKWQDSGDNVKVSMDVNGDAISDLTFYVLGVEGLRGTDFIL